MIRGITLEISFCSRLEMSWCITLEVIRCSTLEMSWCETLVMSRWNMLDVECWHAFISLARTRTRQILCL